ncbi:hypothetical protein [Rhodopseudomonas sp. BAL398]|uniref:hypothetical protein n=1 Tax=Rhodopseudomonas sp. BAL398 TaxID=3034676 RepID=UPI00191C44A9|nr:hypothetical protein [Rhodopseudomonas sp. BAL398]MDF3814120.1 hypothetical protein [Rhodopseudomonas sp. BAL398]WOK15504.1 hypothetical protein RBJ75_15040 [Rhodopseudomonas sp. BAL398]
MEVKKLRRSGATSSTRPSAVIGPTIATAPPAPRRSEQVPAPDAVAERRDRYRPALRESCGADEEPSVGCRPLAAGDKAITVSAAFGELADFVFANSTGPSSVAAASTEIWNLVCMLNLNRTRQPANS